MSSQSEPARRAGSSVVIGEHRGGSGPNIVADSLDYSGGIFWLNRRARQLASLPTNG